MRVVDMGGHVLEGLEGLAWEFRALFEEGLELGGSLAVRDGALLARLFGGLADASRGIPWRADTSIGVHSGSKRGVAGCVGRLIFSAEARFAR